MCLALSKHFRYRWREQFDEEPPPPERIERICSESIWLQKGRLLQEPDGTQYKLLSTFWHPERGLVIKIDRLSDPPRAVTVITGRRQTGRNGETVKRGEE
jgi:hypothetical protein